MQKQKKQMRFLAQGSPRFYPTWGPTAGFIRTSISRLGRGEILKTTGLHTRYRPCSPGLGGRGWGNTFLGTVVVVRQTPACDLPLQPPEEPGS